VTPTTAIVLLEIDDCTAVTCIATDALSGRQHRLTRRLNKGRPFAFLMEDLEPDRNYEVRSVVNPFFFSYLCSVQS
jgi:hypothetical protein